MQTLDGIQKFSYKTCGGNSILLIKEQHLINVNQTKPIVIITYHTILVTIKVPNLLCHMS
jgi:hypothetical protein